MIELAAPAGVPAALLAALLALLLPLPAGLAWPRARYRGGQLAAAAAREGVERSAERRGRDYRWRLRAALLLLAAVTVQPQWLAGQQLIEERQQHLPALCQHRL